MRMRLEKGFRGAWRSEMNQDQHIVAGGGWLEKKSYYRPKATLFGVLSLLWVFISLGCIVILSNGSGIRRNSIGAVLSSLPLQHWVALFLFGIHFVWAGLAWHFWRTEKPVLRITKISNPDTKLSNLYVNPPK